MLAQLASLACGKSDKLGSVMELVGQRRGELEEMHVRGEYTHARFNIPARGLIGLRTRLLNATQGTAVIHHRYAGYRPQTGEVPRRPNGVFISMVGGRANAYGLNTLQERCELFVTHNDEVASAADRIVRMRDGKVDGEGLTEVVGAGSSSG